MTKITQLPVVSAMGDQSVFVVVDNGVTKKLTYSTLKATLKGDKGETGLQGPKGDTGAPGATGAKGDTGAQGPIGPLAQFNTATSARLGGIKIGTGVDIASDGTLSVPIVTLTTATPSAVGVVAVGRGLVIDGTGLLATDPSSSISYYKQYTVTAPTSSAFLISPLSGSNPAISSVRPGATYSFVLNNPDAHPFEIRLAAGGNLVTEGQWTFIGFDGTIVTGSGATVNTGRFQGVLYWTIPDSPTQYLYYYQCTHHAGMIGQITVYNQTSTVNGLISTSYTAIGQDLLPDASAIRSIGSQTNLWNIVHTTAVDVAGVTVAVSQATGKLTSTGGFEIGKSITNVAVASTTGQYLSAPNVKIIDVTGQGFTATTALVPTRVAIVEINRIDSLPDLTTNNVTVSIAQPNISTGTVATATAVVDYFINSVNLLYNPTPTASIVTTQNITLANPPTIQIFDLAQAATLASFLPYQSLSELRDGLPKFTDPVTNQLKTLKITSVNTTSGLITFDSSVALATLPAKTWVFSVPTQTISDGSYPVICQGVTVGALVANGGTYAPFIADRLDSARLPAGVSTATFVSLTCGPLTGAPGFYYLSSEQAGNINKSRVRYGVTAIDVNTAGSGYTSAPAVTVSVNGTPNTAISATAYAILTATNVASVTVTNFGQQYTDAATGVLQQAGLTGPTVSIPTSDSNLWQVTTVNYPLGTSRTAGTTLYVTAPVGYGNGSGRGATVAIQAGMTATSLSNPGATPGTVVSVQALWNLPNSLRLYRVVMSASSSAATNEWLNFGEADSQLTLTKQAAQPVLSATSSTVGTVKVGRGLKVLADGYVRVNVAGTPATSKGAVGDKAGLIAADATYVYYCTTDYTTGTADIWKRVALAVDTW